MTSSVYDVAIIGGGPAGGALAAELASSGRRVVLCERERVPRAKLCGEFLSGEARGYLAHLGCLEEVLEAGAVEIARVRFTAPSGRVVEIVLPQKGLGLSRKALDFILWQHAERHGAVCLAPAAVERVEFAREDVTGARDDNGMTLEVRLPAGEDLTRKPARLGASLVVGAYGRRSPLDRELRRPYLAKRHPYVGFKRHHRPARGRAGDRLGAELQGAVEIHVFDGGYCGLSFVEGGEVNVCALLEERFVRRLPASRWDTVREALCAGNKVLRRRLEALEPADDVVQAVAGVPFTSKERRRGPVLFAGDAAGMIAPFSGDGQAMALRSALLLARLLGEFPARPTRQEFLRLGRRWDRLWRREFGLRMRLGRWLQPLLMRRRMAEFAAWALSRSPSVGRLLVRAMRGEQTVRRMRAALTSDGVHT